MCGIADTDIDSDGIEDCNDEYPDCFDNYYDCNEDCGGCNREWMWLCQCIWAYQKIHVMVT